MRTSFMFAPAQGKHIMRKAIIDSLFTHIKVEENEVILGRRSTPLAP